MKTWRKASLAVLACVLLPATAQGQTMKLPLSDWRTDESHLLVDGLQMTPNGRFSVVFTSKKRRMVVRGIAGQPFRRARVSKNPDGSSTGALLATPDGGHYMIWRKKLGRRNALVVAFAERGKPAKRWKAIVRDLGKGDFITAVGPNGQAAVAIINHGRRHSLVRMVRLDRDRVGAVHSTFLQARDGTINGHGLSVDAFGGATFVFSDDAVVCTDRSINCVQEPDILRVNRINPDETLAPESAFEGCESVFDLAESLDGSAILPVTCGEGHDEIDGYARRLPDGRFGAMKQVTSGWGNFPLAASLHDGRFLIGWEFAPPEETSSGKGTATVKAVEVSSTDAITPEIALFRQRFDILYGPGNPNPRFMSSADGIPYVTWTDKRSRLRIARINPGPSLGPSKFITRMPTESHQVEISREGNGIALAGYYDPRLDDEPNQLISFKAP